VQKEPVVLDVKSFQELESGTVSLDPLKRLPPQMRFCWCDLCSANGLRTEWEALWDRPKSLEYWDAKYAEFFALLPSRVIGFALKAMEWAQFLVRDISDIDYNRKEDVWDNLQMVGNKSKPTLKALVENHTSSTRKQRIKDLVAGKGAGLVILLHGEYFPKSFVRCHY